MDNLTQPKLRPIDSLDFLALQTLAFNSDIGLTSSTFDPRIRNYVHRKPNAKLKPRRNTHMVVLDHINYWKLPEGGHVKRFVHLTLQSDSTFGRHTNGCKHYGPTEFLDPPMFG